MQSTSGGAGGAAQPSAPDRGHDAPGPRNPSGPATSGSRLTGGPQGRRATYAALDLGTNNCRLLVARPNREGFRIIDAFSRIVRLGEGVSRTGQLGEDAISRTLAALGICRDKMVSRGVTRARLIATEACRSASNGESFLGRVRTQVGLDLEIVDRETEAELAAAGCSVLADPQASAIVLFDIGGGSTEIVWYDCTGARKTKSNKWTSLPLGVVTLAEKFGGHNVDAQTFEAMVADVRNRLQSFEEDVRSEKRCERFHLLGTSGTVTTVAGVHLGLLRYDRRRVDGLWMSRAEVDTAISDLRKMSFSERAANGCIGPERADLVLAGCAILEAIREAFPSERVRIADRGLREGILMQLMHADQVWGQKSHHQTPDSEPDR